MSNNQILNEKNYRYGPKKDTPSLKTPLVIRKMKIKAERFHFTPTRMAIMKKKNMTAGNVNKLETSSIPAANVKKTVWKFLKDFESYQKVQESYS
jgi:hypothetical protein